MISAIRAAPLRVLFLAVAVAVCGLMTVADLPSAAPVHAQEQAVTATKDATGESPPARPTDLQASAKHDSVSLTWTASSDQSVTHYAVLRRDRDKDDAGVFKVIDSNAGSGLSYTDGSVSAEGSYAYRVKAVSPTGVSQWSSYVKADTPAVPTPTPEPDSVALAPGNLSADPADDGGVALTWDAPAQDADSVTGYEVLRAQGGGDLATLLADTGSADTFHTDATATAAGETYSYAIIALRGEEKSQRSNQAQVQVPHDPEDLAPSGLSAKAVFDGGDSAGVELAWNAPAVDAESVTGYEILRAQGDGDLATLVADTGSTAVAYADPTATEPGEAYSYQVIASRGEGKSQPSDRAEVIIPKATAVDPEPGIAEEQNVAPAVSDVDVTSEPGDDDTYAIGDRILVTVTFDQAVTVTGAPRIKLRVGGGDAVHQKWADYTSGSGNEALLFAYTVQAGDFDDNGFYIAADELELNGGTIQSSGGTDANLDYPLQGGQSGHNVDGVLPTPEFAATSDDGNSIIILLSEPLAATTAPASAFTLSVDPGTAPSVSSASASGHFVTLALAGALTSDQAVTVTYVDATLGNDSAAVQDAAGNDAANFTTGEGGVPAVSNAIGTGCSLVDGCYVVSADWGLIPSGLGAGAEFRLIFISSTTRNASSSDITDYNTLVQTAAAAGHADIQVYGSTFRVVGSTADVDARDNTATRYTGDDTAGTDDDSDLGVPIYWLAASKVADEYKDFYDGDWDDEANAKDESGSNRSTTQDTDWPLTGSDHDGTESFTGMSSRALGSSSSVRVGRPNSATSGNGPLRSNNAYNSSIARPLYGLSPVFRVAGQVVTNTAPAFTTSPDFSTNENQAATFQVTAMDPDDGDEVTYAITGGADQAKFDIDASSGVLTFKDAPDHENPTDADGNNVYLVTVTATGGTGARALTADQAITVTVTALDEIWSATMTVGVNSTLLGWDDAGNYIGSALSDEDFDYGGDTYNLSVIRLASGSLIVIFNDTGAGDLATNATRDKITLHVDGTPFNFGAGALNAAQTGVGWTNSGLTWSDGDTVELKITVSEDAEVALTSDPGADDTYAIGDAIEATATFGQAVTVTGTPQIEMQVGGETRTADYASGSGSTNLVFSYTVVEGDLDADGVAVELGLIDLNGGTILVGTTAAGLIHGAVSASTDHQVDGVRPIFVSAETNEAGTRIFVTFSEPISAANVNQMRLSGAIPVTLIEIDGAVVELDPGLDFTHDTTRTMEFAIGFVRDLAGNANASSSNNAITNNVLAVCGTLPTGRLWSACLTAGEVGSGIYGYQPSDSTGNLAPATFDVGTTTYTVTLLSDNIGSFTGVKITLQPALATADASNLTLHLGDDTSLFFADASSDVTSSISQYRWSRTAALGWTTGDAIVVGITQKVNTAPSFQSESATREVAENSAAGVDVGGPVTATDGDDDTLTYTLEGTDAAAFAIDASTGQIQTETGVTYDHESQLEYSVTVKADDGKGGTDTIAVAIDIIDVEERPLAPAAPTVSAVDGTTDSLSVSWTAPDNSGKPDIESYDLQYRKGSAGIFTDGPQDVTVTTATIGGLDAGSEYQVQVRATNDEGDGAWSSPGSGTTGASAEEMAETPVPTTWSLVPSGLGDGDNFRLLFIGSSNSNANSSDIDVYNTFVQNLVATKGHEDIQAHSATFRMLGSTEEVDARDNTGTTGTGVPIYWLGGAKVADDYDDFYDGNWDEEATGRRETGVSVSIGTDWKIWTGSAHDGTEAMDTGTGTSRALGNAGNHWVMQGSPNGSDSTHGPIQGNTAGRGTNRGVYGLSGVFTVDASLDVDPPGAPRNVEATAGTGKVTLTWDAPASEGGGEITHYEYQRKEGSGDYGDWTTAETVEFGTDSHSAILRDATTLDHYDVKAETTYTYRVRAVNAGGGGDASGEDSATTGAAMTVRIEASPQRVMEDEGPVTVTVVAEMPATGPNTEKYDLEFVVFATTRLGTASVGQDDYVGIGHNPVFAPDDFGDFVTESGSWVAKKSYTVTITDDDVFEQDETFEVVVEPAGSSLLRPKHPFVTIPGDTDEVTVTILNDDYVPEVPAEQFDVLLGETDAGRLPAMDSRDGDTLTWTLTGGDDENLFTLSSDGQLSLKTARTSLENPGDDNGDGVYELTVTVSDGHHTPVSGPITVRLFDVTKPPRTPGAPWVWALDGSTSALDVRWPEIQGEAVRSYDLRYRKDGGGDWEDGPQDVTNTRAEITGLESGTPYEVQVRATNSRGDSEWSPSTTGYPATVYDIDGIYIYWTDRQGSDKIHDDVADLGSNTLENACDTGESFRAYWLQPLESRDADEWEADVQTIEGTGTAQYRFRTPPELTGVVSLDGFTVIGIRIRGRFGDDWSNWSRAVNLICVPT